MTTQTHDTLLRRAGRHLPGPIRDAIWRRTRGRKGSAVRWGNLHRTEPFSRHWGEERGLPVDRVYIERFLEEHADDVHGVVLEAHPAVYTSRFGGGSVTTAEVLDLDGSNAQATIVGDLADAGTLPASRFDCVILTQTLQFVDDTKAALANAYQALKPGGVLLLTVPCISQIERSWDDLWRWTPLGLQRLIAAALPAEAVCEFSGEGNVLTAVAFLLGLASQDLGADDYDVDDPAYPVILGARVERPASSE
jgi:SAM-dependent methyltransferase